MNLETYKNELGKVAGKDQLDFAEYKILITKFEELTRDIALAVENGINPEPYEKQRQTMIDLLTNKK